MGALDQNSNKVHNLLCGLSCFLLRQSLFMSLTCKNDLLFKNKNQSTKIKAYTNKPENIPDDLCNRAQSTPGGAQGSVLNVHPLPPYRECVTNEKGW